METHSDKLRQQFEGVLSKYTNVMKGWQPRWFVLDPEMGTLSYFLSDSMPDHKSRVRGAIHLAAAVISPSDEDSNTFTVNSTNGELFKLRAGDARARQEWVNRLRAVAEMHTIAIAQSNPPLPPREHHTLGTSAAAPNPLVHCTMALLDAFSMVRDHLHKAENCNSLLVRAVEDLPVSGPGMHSSDADLLVLKATTSATLQCLGHCLSILQQQQLAPPSTPALPPVPAVPGSSQSLSSTGKPALSKKNSLPSSNAPASPSHFEGKKSGNQRSLPTQPVAMTSSQPDQSRRSDQQQDPLKKSDVSQRTVPVEFAKVEASYISPSDREDKRLKEKDKDDLLKTSGKPQEEEPSEEEEQVTDDEDVRIGGSGGGKTFQAEENKSVILHLLSQLKLGMDLTKVVLPTFILERRSLLEMFADCLGHPNLFVKIMESPTPEDRMMAVVEWYLTSLHIGRDCSIAKKPYNPIIGETFHCSWRVPQANNTDFVHYTAEQVSHHPPVTAFYAECPTRNMCLNASIWTKSNFSGMSVGVAMVGDVSLHLGDIGERYDFTLPSAYARSIISVPWIELGGKVVINCPQTRHSANIIFHTKPFYGGKVHQVTGDVRNDAGVNICKIQGEWNSSFEFVYPGQGRTNVIDVTRLPVIHKRVKPLSKQGNMESRRLWNEVTNALAEGDINRATEHKRSLEEQQRAGEKHRAATGTAFPTHYFHRTDDDSWMYNNMLVSV